MYECLNGQPVFTAENSLALIFKHVHETPSIIESSSGQILVPNWLNTVISRALAKAPDDRFQNMEELRQALDEGTPAMSVSPPPSTTKPATVDTSVPIKVGIATLFVTAIGTFFYFASPRLRPPLPEKTTAPALIVPADIAPQPSKGDRSPTAPQANAVPQQPKETVREGDREKHSRSVHPSANKAKPSNKWPHKLESKLKSILRKL
jgi:serine/threonine protein kinase